MRRALPLVLVAGLLLPGCITYYTGESFPTAKGYAVATAIELALAGATIGITDATTGEPHYAWCVGGVVAADALAALVLSLLAVPAD